MRLESPLLGQFGIRIYEAASCLAPSKAHASSCVPASPTSKRLHVGNIGRGLEATGDESFTATLHIGPTRHLPAHLQKETLQSNGLCTISSRCKVSPAIA
ncbi:hypothetical protein V8E51_006830 [Hyaloscypha variabilis]